MNRKIAEAIAKGISEGSLKDLYEGIRKALVSDDGNPGQKDPWYGVRVFDDWKEWADILEREMTLRNLDYKPISW